MKQVVRTLVAAGPDAIQLSVGLAPLLQSQPGRDKPALVLRSDVANVYGPEPPSEPFSVVVDDAVGHWERASGQAAEGIRTLDLLHGKRNVRHPVSHEYPCKRLGSRHPRAHARFPGIHREITRVWAPKGYPSWPSRWLPGATC